MKITLEMIMSALQAEMPDVQIKYEKMPQAISSIRLFPRNISSMSDSYLYVTDIYDESAFSKIGSSIPVICFTSDPGAETAFPNVGLIYSSLELADGFNMVLQSYNHFIDWGKRLDFEIYREASFQDLLDISTDIFPCPILVYDPALKLLAYSGSEYASKNTMFKTAVANGYLDMDAVRYFESTNTFEQINTNGITHGAADDYRTQSDIIKAININNQLAVYCVLLQTDSFSGSYPDQLFEILCNSFYELMMKHHMSFIKDRSVADYFLMDLLDNPDTPSGQIEERLQFTDLGFHGCFSVIVIHSDIIRRFAVEYFIQYLRIGLTDCRVFEYKDSFVILFILPESVRADYKQYINNKLHTMFSDFPNNNIRSFVSKPFSSVAGFPYAYDQSDRAFLLTDSQDSGIYYYEDLWIADLLQSNVKDKFYYYCEPCIADLINRKTDKSKLQLTILYEYLTHDRNSTAVAEKLFMHRNNVIYHIKQLQENYNLNLDDYRTRLKLQLSFEMLDNTDF